MNIAQMLVNSARRLGDRPAVRWGERTHTYAELDARSSALAHGLVSLGLQPGDRVAIYMRNRPEFLEAMYACFRARLAIVPLDSRFTSEEVAYHLDDSGALAVITEAERVATVLAAGPGARRVLVCGDDPAPFGAEALETLIDASGPGAFHALPTDRDDLAWLFYTSGTTGRPKGAMLTHGNLTFMVASWLADLTPMGDGDVTLHAAPLTHGAGMHALASTARGACHVLLTGTRFDPQEVIGVLARERVANTWMVPTQIVMLTDVAEAAPPDLPDLRAIVYGGAPFAPAELRRALEVFGPVFVQLFGQGETPMTATMLPASVHAAAIAGEHPARLSSAGYVRPGTDVRILGDDDVELPLGEVGEVCVQGPTVMLGYWDRPEATAETLRGGWLHTGDLGRIDDHGYLYLLDRAKDLIITGGSNVYAVEVEAVLADHPHVEEVAVVGLPDRTWGEIVVAVIVTTGGAEEMEAALTSHCAERLAGYKQPRQFHFVDALPRNAYGKVLKRDLRSQLVGCPIEI